MKDDVDKKSLRRHFLALRQAVSEDDALQHSFVISAQLLTLIPPEARVIAGYNPARGEADIFPALLALAAREKTIALPAITPEKQLVFRAWQPGDTLTANRYGMLEPPASGKSLTPDVLLVPLLAYDAEGFRLGYGGGYYDRTIAALREAKILKAAIGIAYACQEHPRLPVEPHDQPLDAVVTEMGIIHLKR